MTKGKKKVDLNKSINDPELRKLSNKIYKMAGRLKKEDFTDRFTI